MTQKISFFSKKIVDHTLEFKVVGDLSSNNLSLILLHEGLGSVSMWKDVPEKIYDNTGYNVVTYSRAGYGKSSTVILPRPLDYMSIEAKKYLPEVINQLHLKQYILIGHSDGGTIAALNSASVQSNDLKGIVLVAPHFFIEKFNIESIKKIRNKYEKEGLREKLSRYHDDVDNAFYGWCDTWLNPNFHSWDITDEIQNIKKPVCAIQGNTDPYGSVKQIEVLEKKLYVNVSKLILEKCGHNPFFERTEKSIKYIKSFINEIENLKN